MKMILITLLMITVCANAQETPTQSPEEPKAERAGSLFSEFRFGIGISHSVGSYLLFKDLYLDSSNSLDFELETDNVPSFEIEARMMTQQKWGILLGLTYDMERKVTGGKAKVNGNSVNLNTTDPAKLQVTVISGNIIYQPSEFYFPFGMNLALVKFKPGSTFGSDTTMTTYLGLQGGVGYWINEHFAIEGIYRYVSLKLKGSGTPTDKKDAPFNGSLSNFIATAKYIF